MKKSPKNTTKKRMTIEDLARMVANSLSEFRAEFNGRMDKMEDKLDIHIAQTSQGFEKVNQRLDVHIIQTAEGFEDAGKRFDSLEAGTHRRITLVESTIAGMMKREVKK